MKPKRLHSKTQAETWEFTRPDHKSDDDFDVGSVETNAEHDNWSLQELEQKKDNVAQDKKDSRGGNLVAQR